MIREICLLFVAWLFIRLLSWLRLLWLSLRHLLLLLVHIVEPEVLCECLIALCYYRKLSSLKIIQSLSSLLYDKLLIIIVAIHITIDSIIMISYIICVGKSVIAILALVGVSNTRFELLRVLMEFWSTIRPTLLLLKK